MTLTHLKRYAPLVDDLPAFLEAAATPLPRVVWLNPLRTDLDATAARLRDRCPELTPILWRPHTYRLPPTFSPGRLPEFITGELHVQEEAALWPAALIEAVPGQRVLDLCAAPGNKTAQLAIAMEDRGIIVANDRQAGRLSALRRLVDRLGLTSVVVTCQDGVSFPLEAPGYDAVLVDAPCSAEGTSRKPGGRVEEVSTSFRTFIAGVQLGLLRRALTLVRPGGRVVYSTCTYAPEENEAVVAAVLGEGVELLPLIAPLGLRASPGVTSFEGRQFPEAVRQTARLWPHHNDTGGFFVAAMRRLPERPETHEINLAL